MLIGNDRAVKLVDFGIAKILPESGKELQKLTQTGAVFGTFAYMSPEQCLANSADARSDVYAMGCMMFEVLDGEPPFQGETPYEIISKHLSEPPRKSAYVEGDVGAVILSALQKNPSQRPSSAAEFQNALSDPQSFLKDIKLSVPGKRIKPGKRKLSWIIVPALCASALLVWLLSTSNKPSAPPAPPQTSHNEKPDPYSDTELHILEAELTRSKDRPESSALADSFHKLAFAYSTHGRDKEALPLLKRAMQIRERTSVNDPKIAEDLYTIASIYCHGQRYKEADPLLRRAIAIKEQAYGPKSLELAAPLNYLADIDRTQHNYIESEKLFKRAIQIREQQQGLVTSDLADGLQGLAILYAEQERFAEAETLFKRALEIRKEAEGPRNHDVASCAYELASVYMRWRKYAQAEPYYKDALAMVEENPKTKDDEIAWGQAELANCYRWEGKYAEAEPLLKQALTTWAATGAAPKVKVINRTHDYIEILTKLNRTTEAEAVKKQLDIMKNTPAP
jgi:tetratricopeptide (TPR) repeat protein